MGCCPELDVSQIFGLDEASYYQSLIKEMRQMVEIGCIDIKMQFFPTFVILMITKKEAFRRSTSCHGLFEAQTLLVISI